MSIEQVKEKLHLLIDTTTNETLLVDLLLEAQRRTVAPQPHEAEGLMKEDFDELLELASEPADKDTISYDDLKSSLNKWFTK